MQVHFEELNVHFPIGGHHPVAAIVHVVAEIVQDRLLCRRPRIGVETLFAEQLVDGAGCYCRQEFSFRIGPLIRAACLKEKRARRDERYQQIRIHRRSVGESGILGVIGRELIWIARGRGEVRDGLSVIATAKRRTTLARATGDDGSESLVVRAGPHHSLTKPRDSVDRDASCIDTLVGLEVIFRAAHATRQATIEPQSSAARSVLPGLR